MNTLTADFEKRYPGSATIGAAFERPASEFSVTVLFGPSGCGKTTILRCLAGLERPDRGHIRYGGETWNDTSAGTFVPPQRRGIGFLFQDYALFPHMTVGANISYGLRNESARERQKLIADMLDALRLSGLEGRYPTQLSGGEQQRVALARAVVRKPRLLLLDEPLSALDAPTRDKVRRELRRLLSAFSIPCFIVTHDRLEAVALGDYMMVLDHGTVRQSGPLDQVFSRPADALVAQMVGVETVVSGRVVRVENGLATIAVGDVQIVAVAKENVTIDVHICIRGEDVILLTSAGEQSSPRNRLVGRVVSLSAEGPTTRVELDCGFPLTAVVTRPAIEELGLHVGQSLVALIKAAAIYILPRR